MVNAELAPVFAVQVWLDGDDWPPTVTASVLAAITNVGIQTPGSYTVLPTNPVMQSSTSGSAISSAVTR